MMLQNVTRVPVLADLGTNKEKLLLAILGSVAIAISAQISVPFYPVPITAQTLVVLLIAISFGAKLATGTVMLYLAQGAMGLPVFANGGAGLPYMVGPTGGYLFGFLVATYVVGSLAERGLGRDIWSAATGMFVGHSVIYFFGVAYLSTIIGVEKAVAGGLMPFLYGDALKIVLGAILLPMAWKKIER